MSDVPAAPGWWQASDGKWYPPEQFPAPPTPPAPPGHLGGYPPGHQAGSPPGYQGGYPMSGYPAYGGPPAAPRNEPMAIVSLCLALVGLPIGLLCCAGLGATVTAIVLGVLAKKRIDQSGGALTGRGLAQAGFVVGIVGTVLIVFENLALQVLLSGSS